MATLDELIEIGKELAPKGGDFEFGGENQVFQAEYLAWRIESLERLKGFDSPIEERREEIQHDHTAELFYREKANDLLAVLMAAKALRKPNLPSELKNIKLTEISIQELAKTIIGEGGNSPYRKKQELKEFLNQYIDTDEKHGYGNRFYHTERKLKEYNNTQYIEQIVLGLLHPIYYGGSYYDPQSVVKHLNGFLRFEGWEIQPFGAEWVVEKREADVAFRSPHDNSSHLSHIFISEQIAKCDEKISNKDYDGAITNARSMVEAVLREIEQDLDENPPKHDGDLVKLYKRVQKLLNLTPDASLPDNLKQLLSGLTSTINGIASLRNKMGDAHVVSYKAQKHHAELAVNSAKTICRFLYDSKSYQENKED